VDEEARKPIEGLRHLCLALPEVSERLSQDEPSWSCSEGVREGRSDNQFT